ncbi:hypothetical protein DQ04_10061000 [Trypanosoma grayi]|uniref:hypothetical protein n=1 Tax=Trypanosoma grayi TaxID=71804 RepID=UPI0004F495A1|nr:hypothetical protein DQ04_10061000 [Trypanosoma grayi]KEG07353.1 hypothetical protein DQ04_10061000 [Trypanosoma grayi]
MTLLRGQRRTGQIVIPWAVSFFSFLSLLAARIAAPLHRRIKCEDDPDCGDGELVLPSLFIECGVFFWVECACVVLCRLPECCVVSTIGFFFFHAVLSVVLVVEIVVDLNGYVVRPRGHSMNEALNP